MYATKKIEINKTVEKGDYHHLLDETIARVKMAQAIYSHFTQAQVDKIFKAAALAANRASILLANEAVDETEMGVVGDKIIKNQFASEAIYNKYRDTKTCGVIAYDPIEGIRTIAEPVGVIAGIIPTTNPTSTAIFKALLALKTRNGILFSPHPRAKECTIHAAKIVLDAAVAAGAPEDIIAWFDNPTLELTDGLMKHADVSLILATGGPAMVKAAYSSGNPALGVGPGNTPVVIDETANITNAVTSIISSKTFDNGTICASEQSIVAVSGVYETVVAELTKQGCFILEGDDRQKVSQVMMFEGRLNANIVGQSAVKIAEMAGIKVPQNTKILVAKATEIGETEPYSHEKLSPILALYLAKDFDIALTIAKQLLETGKGHTAALYTGENNQERIALYGDEMQAGRILINTPSSQGAIGGIYNTMAPSLTLGTGTHGGNIISENVGVKHLMNTKTVAERRENTQWFKGERTQIVDETYLLNDSRMPLEEVSAA